MKLHPSTAHRWSKCAAFPSFAAHVPRKPQTDPAKEGSCAAWVAKCVLTGQAENCSAMIGQTHPNGWVVTSEMAADVQEYVKLVTSRGQMVAVEQTVRFSDDPLIEGVPDSSSLSVVGDTLYVDDLKYGRRIVEVWDNAQLIIYAASILYLYRWTVQKIQLGIYQPRSFHSDGIYRTWVLAPYELLQHAELLHEAARECDAPNPIATPGPHCSGCSAAGRCEALAQSNYAYIDRVRSTEQRQMTAVELSREMDFLTEAADLLDARKDAVFAEIEERVKNEPIMGWGVKPRFGNSKFTVSGAVIQAGIGIDPWDKKLCSPAELKRRGADPDLVKTISKQVQIGSKVVRVTPRDIKRAFKAEK